jgi:uncharacterized protein YxeA
MKKALLIIVPIIAIVVVGIALYYNEETTSEYFFAFDEVTYYKTDKGFNDLSIIDDKKVKTLKDSITSKMMSDFEEAISYDVAVTYLDSIGFKHKQIPVSKHDALREIFREKSTKRTEWVSCEPIYRDIYVFKKNGKVSGIAKLCYECGLFQLLIPMPILRILVWKGNLRN